MLRCSSSGRATPRPLPQLRLLLRLLHLLLLLHLPLLLSLLLRLLRRRASNLLTTTPPPILAAKRAARRSACAGPRGPLEQTPLHRRGYAQRQSSAGVPPQLLPQCHPARRPRRSGAWASACSHGTARGCMAWHAQSGLPAASLSLTRMARVTWPTTMATSRRALVATRYLLLGTTYYLLLTTYDVLLTTYCLLLSTCFLLYSILLTAHYLLRRGARTYCVHQGRPRGAGSCLGDRSCLPAYATRRQRGALRSPRRCYRRHYHHSGRTVQDTAGAAG